MLERRRSGWLVRSLDRLAAGLDGLLGSFVGSAQIGPYVAPEQERPLSDIDCPVCGQPISRHDTARSAAIGRLYCPPPLASDRGGRR